MANMFNPNDPRVRRAFAHSARTELNKNSTLDNINRALEYDAALASGPKKSFELGASAVIRALDETHVAFVDWTAGPNYGGGIIPKSVADGVISEVRMNAVRDEQFQTYTMWHEALSSSYPRWVSGEMPGDVDFLSSLTPSDALKRSVDTTVGFFDDTKHPIDEAETVAGAVARAIIKKRLESE